MFNKHKFLYEGDGGAGAGAGAGAEGAGAGADGTGDQGGAGGGAGGAPKDGEPPADPAGGKKPILAADKAGEGGGDKGDKGGAPGDIKALEAYAYKFPEGVTKESAAFKEFLPIAGELKLQPESVQRLMEYDARRTEAQIAAWEKQVNDWQAASESDPEFGGANMDETATLASRVIVKFAGEKDAQEVFTQLARAGLDVHPAFVRMFRKFAVATGESAHGGGSGMGTGDTGGGAQSDFSGRYPKMAAHLAAQKDK